MSDSNNNFKESLNKNKHELYYLNKKDRRMRFNNAKDPIYFAFDYIEKASVSTLFKDFIKDSIFEIKKFFSKIIKLK